MAEKIYVKFNKTGAQKYIVLASGEPVTSDRITEVAANNTEALSYIEQGLFIPYEKEEYDAQDENKKKFDGKGMIDFSMEDDKKVAVSKRVAQSEENKEKAEELKVKALKEQQEKLDKQVKANEDVLKSEEKKAEEKKKMEEQKKTEEAKKDKPKDFKENTIIDGVNSENTLKE